MDVQLKRIIRILAVYVLSSRVPLPPLFRLIFTENKNFSESSARSEQDLNSSFLADDASSVLSFGSAGDAPTRSLTPTSSNSAGEGRLLRK